MRGKRKKVTIFLMNSFYIENLILYSNMYIQCVVQKMLLILLQIFPDNFSLKYLLFVRKCDLFGLPLGVSGHNPFRDWRPADQVSSQPNR